MLCIVISWDIKNNFVNIQSNFKVIWMIPLHCEIKCPSLFLSNFFHILADQKLLCHIGSESTELFSYFGLIRNYSAILDQNPLSFFSYFGLIRNYSAILDQNPLSNIFRTIHILFQLKWLYGFLNRRFFFHISSNQKHY